MQPSFFFYDYETFGINPYSDKIAQFGGIRTDLDLNIIGEPIVQYCKPSDDFLPDPVSILVTGITPQECIAKGVRERDFANAIHKEFSEPETCIVGYNNIRFDDEFTRALFYRNFLDPYAYSYKHDNSRWDLLDVVRACYALRPNGINWPMTDEGIPSFKLESLTKANHISHDNAHDALSDVYATIEMAKLIKHAQPRLFDYFFKLRHKKAVLNMLDFDALLPVVHVSGMFGSHRANASIIAPIIKNPTNQNAAVVIDLAGDVNTLIELTPEEIRDRLYTKTEDLAENQHRIPIKSIYTNKAPIIAPIETMTEARAEQIGLNLELCKSNLELIRQNQSLIAQKLNVVMSDSVRTYEKFVDAEQRLYDGFFDDHDRYLIAQINAMNEDSLPDSANIDAHDNRIPDLLLRYKARNYPNSLTEREQHRWETYRLEQFTEEKLQIYITNLEQLVHQHHGDELKIALLKQIFLYCGSITH